MLCLFLIWLQEYARTIGAKVYATSAKTGVGKSIKVDPDEGHPQCKVEKVWKTCSRT